MCLKASGFSWKGQISLCYVCVCVSVSLTLCIVSSHAFFAAAFSWLEKSVFHQLRRELYIFSTYSKRHQRIKKKREKFRASHLFSLLFFSSSYTCDLRVDLSLLLVRFGGLCGSEGLEGFGLRLLRRSDAVLEVLHRTANETENKTKKKRNRFQKRQVFLFLQQRRQ